MTYNGFEYEYDEFYDEYIIYDENMKPLSASFKTVEDVKATIDTFIK